MELARRIEVGLLARERLESGAPGSDAPFLRQLVGEGEAALRTLIGDTLSAERDGVDVDRDPVLGDLADDDGMTAVGGGLAAEAVREFTAPSLHDSVAALPVREAHLLTLRFGLDGALPRTLDELSDVLGLPPERIRRVEQRGIRMLRQLAEHHSE